MLLLRVQAKTTFPGLGTLLAVGSIPVTAIVSGPAVVAGRIEEEIKKGLSK